MKKIDHFDTSDEIQGLGYAEHFFIGNDEALYYFDTNAIEKEIIKYSLK